MEFQLMERRLMGRPGWVWLSRRTNAWEDYEWMYRSKTKQFADRDGERWLDTMDFRYPTT